MTWQLLSGLNRVTESTAKELILAQISESKCCEQTFPPSKKVKSSASASTSTAKTSQSTDYEEETEKKCPVKRRKISQNVHQLNHIKVQEILIRRWVASKDREN